VKSNWTKSKTKNSDPKPSDQKEFEMRQAYVTNWFNEMDDLFQNFSPALKTSVRRNAFSPQVDVQETEKEYLFQFDLPGLSEKELELKVAGRELTVSGERKIEEATDKTKRHRSERSFGGFERSFVLPEDVNSEKTEAAFQNGVLTVRIPKSESAGPKTIPIRTH
jgi:HSP20 family protein